jgi:Protein of unknown function (DUF2934)
MHSRAKIARGIQHEQDRLRSGGEQPEVEPGSGNSAELEQRIRQRAYELYVARGCHDGHADEDWRLAEEEILGITGGG